MKKKVLFIFSIAFLCSCFLVGCSAKKDLKPTIKCNHIEVTVDAVAATCRREGKTEGKYCELCNEVLVKQETIEKTGHNIAPKTNPAAPTCTTPGRTEGKICIDCLTVIEEVETIPPLGHSEGVDDAVAPTCTEKGLTEGKYCTNCYVTLVSQKSIPKLGHTEVIDKAVSVTCTKDGKTEGKHCSVCNTVLIAQNKIPASHTAGSWIIDIESTCTLEGKKHLECSECAIIIESATIEALGHKYFETITPATIESKASILFNCKNCEYFYSQEIPPITISASLTGSGLIVSSGTYYTRSFTVTASGGYGKYKYKFSSGTNVLLDYSESNTITVQGNALIDLARITISVIDEAGQESIYIIRGDGTYIDSYVNYK